jgi:hypothetical protein
MMKRHVHGWRYLALAAVSLATLVLGAGVAHADDDDLNRTICQQLSLGQSPGQVADEIHQGDATITRQRATQRVWESLGGCPND